MVCRANAIMIVQPWRIRWALRYRTIWWKKPRSSLSNLSGPNGLLLVFHRSADWRPYCRSELVELEQSRATLERNGLSITAVSYDSRQTLQAFAKEHDIEFPL